MVQQLIPKEGQNQYKLWYKSSAVLGAVWLLASGGGMVSGSPFAQFVALAAAGSAGFQAAVTGCLAVELPIACAFERAEEILLRRFVAPPVVWWPSGSSRHPRSDPRIHLRRRLNNDSAPGRAVRPGSKPRDAEDGRPAPFPWATERPAQHDTQESLLRRPPGRHVRRGRARCKRCGARKAIAYDLESKFREVRDFVSANRHAMHDRALDAWMFPALPHCDACGHKGVVSPEIATEKREINWLFLLLRQMLGCCTLEQLRYFCMNTGRNRSGAKNRVLYYAYIVLCSQREPFDGTVREREPVVLQV
ncbi:uncharacterized protein LOC133884736 [Phragmites australis]|uniref:uncharacterized protein LOC133884736 n=1 Tax=Phragmites australis TaxID=29695 RepID=UPI002D78BBA1|nr:uncharacterized protein LOC133884736 [Phragmites australis]